jgi:hypothetical protein
MSGVSWLLHADVLPEVSSKDCKIVSPSWQMHRVNNFTYKTVWHIVGVLLREHDRVHKGCGRVDTLVTKEEAVRSFTLVWLRREYVAEIHGHVKGESGALMRIHCYCDGRVSM